MERSGSTCCVPQFLPSHWPQEGLCDLELLGPGLGSRGESPQAQKDPQRERHFTNGLHKWFLDSWTANPTPPLQFSLGFAKVAQFFFQFTLFTIRHWKSICHLDMVYVMPQNQFHSAFLQWIVLKQQNVKKKNLLSVTALVIKVFSLIVLVILLDHSISFFNFSGGKGFSPFISNWVFEGNWLVSIKS